MDIWFCHPSFYNCPIDKMIREDFTKQEMNHKKAMNLGLTHLIIVYIIGSKQSHNNSFFVEDIARMFEERLLIWGENKLNQIEKLN